MAGVPCLVPPFGTERKSAGISQSPAAPLTVRRLLSLNPLLRHNPLKSYARAEIRTHCSCHRKFSPAMCLSPVKAMLDESFSLLPGPLLGGWLQITSLAPWSQPSKMSSSSVLLVSPYSTFLHTNKELCGINFCSCTPVVASERRCDWNVQGVFQLFRCCHCT